MFAWTSFRAGPVVGSPSPLLQWLAGAFAARVAGLWPAPHAEFLAATAERRHLICLALHAAGEARLAVSASDLLGGRLKTVLRTAVPEAPDGLHRALAKLGETAWTGADYDDLVRLLRMRNASKALRHADKLDVAQVRALARLPAAALEARVGELGLSVAQAEVLTEAYAAVARVRGEAAAEAAARRWGSTGSPRTLFEAALDELHGEPPPPPFAGSTRLRPLGSKAALRGAAARYRNCLRTTLGRAAQGRCAFYEWAGPPGAVVEIVQDDIFGWRLDEARIAGNEPVPEPAREAIAAELRGWGVHIGRTSWQIEHALQYAHTDGFTFEPERDVVAELFGA